MAEGIRRAGPSPIEQFIFFDEAWRAGVLLPTLTIMSVSPMIMQHGSEEQKRFFLPKALHGDVHFSIGYTEPGAGTDLASLRTRAVRDGDHWVINGSKLFTSQAQYADYIWLAARTDPSAKKHDGISIFMVPTSSPGFKMTPLPTMGDVTTNATYYEDVRVPANALVGPENGGWWLIVGQLNHERVSLIPAGTTERFYEETRDWARETMLPDGRRVIDVPWVQQNLARVRAGVEVLKLLNWRQAWSMTRGEMNYAESSTVKVYGSEFYVQAYRLLLEVLGQAGYVKAGSPAASSEGPARAHVPRHPHHDLRRRHERGAARHHRHGRPRHAAVTLMDFGFTPEQEALRDLARSICQDHATHERLKAVERDADWFDRELWSALAEGEPARRVAAGALGLAAGSV